MRSTNAAAVPRSTPVTLACRALVIKKSVAEDVAGVYTSRALRLGDHPMHGDRVGGWSITGPRWQLGLHLEYGARRHHN